MCSKDSLWHKSQQWKLGWKFFYGEGNCLEEMFFRGRTAIALLGTALGLIVYLWSRRLFGVAGGFDIVVIPCAKSEPTLEGVTLSLVGLVGRIVRPE